MANVSRFLFFLFSVTLLQYFCPLGLALAISKWLCSICIVNFFLCVYLSIVNFSGHEIKIVVVVVVNHEPQASDFRIPLHAFDSDVVETSFRSH